MTFLQGLVATFWLLIIVGAVLFVVLYGKPWKYRDREMAWHLFWATVVTGLQPVGLLIAMWSLIPLAIADGLAVVIVYWRLLLLIKTQRLNYARMQQIRRQDSEPGE